MHRCKLVALTEENGEVFLDGRAISTEFENVAMLVNPSDPETSEVAACTTLADGGERHSGGIFGIPQTITIQPLGSQLIKTGNPNATADPVVDVDFEFFRSCVQPIFLLIL